MFGTIRAVNSSNGYLPANRSMLSNIEFVLSHRLVVSVRQRYSLYKT